MESYQTIIDELQTALTKQPDPDGVIQFHLEMLRVQAQAVVKPYSPVIDADQARARLQAAQPLLPADMLSLNRNGITDTCMHIARTAAQLRPDLAKPLAHIHSWLAAEHERTDVLARAYLANGSIEAAQEAGLDPDLVAFVFNNGLHPFLRRAAEALTPLIDTQTWYHPYCPICGGEPDFSALEKESGARRLLCSRCDMEWLFSRIICPFCQAEASMSYYPSEQGPYRLYVCNACRRYLKTIDLRETTRARPLPVERILTIDLDMAARQAE